MGEFNKQEYTVYNLIRKISGEMHSKKKIIKENRYSRHFYSNGYKEPCELFEQPRKVQLVRVQHASMWPIVNTIVTST